MNDLAVILFNIFGVLLLHILASRLAEHRLDDVSSGIAMLSGWKADRERLRSSNYNPQGKRLLLWFKVAVLVFYAVDITWILAS
jgi:hypothetical protein